MRQYLSAIKNYVNFSGRSSRKEYWFFILFNMLFTYAAVFLDAFFKTNIVIDNVRSTYGYIYLLYCLFVMIPSIALLVRRLHDQEKSGAWFFITFIPLVGPIWMLILLCTAGTDGPNQYGSDPRE